MKVVGGTFALELAVDGANDAPFDLDAALRFVNARSALRYVLEARDVRTVWLPQYACDALGAAAADVSEIRFYPVTESLEPEEGSWQRSVAPRDVVVAIDYFGFRRWTDALQPLFEAGVCIVEDASQALFIERSPFADCIFYSPRKFVGVPDGGVLISDLPPPTLDGPPIEWWSKALASVIMRREFDAGELDDRRWFSLFQEAEREAPVGPYRMSDISETILRNGVDYAAVRERRVQNFRTLASSLGDFALYPALDNGTVPLGFPVRTRSRERVQNAMAAERIYPAVHWQSSITAAHPQSRMLSEELLTLPCDQRYDTDDMQRIAAIFLNEQP
jgi:dTDP-4-amino-4,6-dideoxygalactose transaminase